MLISASDTGTRAATGAGGEILFFQARREIADWRHRAVTFVDSVACDACSRHVVDGVGSMPSSMRISSMT